MPCPSIGPKQLWTIQINLDWLKIFGTWFKEQKPVLKSHLWTCQNLFGWIQNNLDMVLRIIQFLNSKLSRISEFLKES